MKYIISLILWMCCYNEFCSGDKHFTELTEKNSSTKRSRLVSFDSEHGDVKIELDFAVPFMTIPFDMKKTGPNGILKPLLNVNTKGLITVATMLFLFVTVIPKIVRIFIPQAHETAKDTIAPIMSRIDEVFNNMDLGKNECSRKSACLIGSVFRKKTQIFNSKSRPSWLNSLLQSAEVEEALQKGRDFGDCNVYHCAFTSEAANKILTAGKHMLNTYLR